MFTFRDNLVNLIKNDLCVLRMKIDKTRYGEYKQCLKNCSAVIKIILLNNL